MNKRVAGLLKGCRCKTGCKTARCGCKKKGNVCSEGCECTDCTNNSSKTDDNVQDSPLDDVVLEEMEENNLLPDGNEDDGSLSNESDEEMEVDDEQTGQDMDY